MITGHRAASLTAACCTLLGLNIFLHHEEVVLGAGKRSRLAFDADEEDDTSTQDAQPAAIEHAQVQRRQIRGQRIQTPSFPGQGRASLLLPWQCLS